MIWRVVSARYATLTEIRSSWTLMDLWSAHQVLDVQEDLEILASH